MFTLNLGTSCRTKKQKALTVSTFSTDSTKMKIQFEFLRGCTELESTVLFAHNYPQLPYVSIRYTDLYNLNTNRFIISKDSFFNAIDSFELQLDGRQGCGGFGGAGTGVYIEKHFNGEVKHYSYCMGYDSSKNWNGLKYFFGLMGKELVDYPFK